MMQRCEKKLRLCKGRSDFFLISINLVDYLETYEVLKLLIESLFQFI